MKLNKVLLVLAVLFGAIFIFPIAAEDTTDIDTVGVVVQKDERGEHGSNHDPNSSREDRLSGWKELEPMEEETEFEEEDLLSAGKPEKPSISYYQLNMDIELSLYASEPDLKFESYISTKPNKGFKKTKNYKDLTGGGSFESWTYSLAKKNAKAWKKYYVKARVYRVEGKKKIYSNWEKGWLKTTCGAATNVVVDHKTKSFKIDWKKAKGADQYMLEVWDSSTDRSYVVPKGATTYTLDDPALDYDNSMTIYIVSMYKGNEYQWAGFNPRSDYFSQVNTVVPSKKGKEVVFNFQTLPDLDIEDYLLRRGRPGGFDTYDFMTYLDYNLYVATKADGKYKRVKTTADFTDKTNLVLKYKAKKGKTLYYKIIPTGEINDDWYVSPINLRSLIGYQYKSSMLADAQTVSFKLK